VCRSHPLFGLGELEDGLGPGHHEGHPQARGQHLGEATQVDHTGVARLPGQLKKAWQAAFPKVELPVGVILHHHQPPFHRHFQKAPAGFQGHEPPGGVLEGGDEVKEAGAFPPEHLLQSGKVWPLLPGGHREEPGSVGPEGLDGPHVAGGLDENRASLVQKDLPQKVQGLLASRGYQDLLGAYLKPVRHPGP
jgi:hypothetical protein